MIKIVRKFSHAWILSYLFLYLPWFAYLEKNVTSNYYSVHSRIDDVIPFNEYFIIPYFIWFLYIAAATLYFFFTSKTDYYQLCAFLFIGMTISLIICTIFPNGTDLRTMIDPDKNICSRLVSMLHKLDTNTNVFPSIHVYNSLGVHFSIVSSQKTKGKTRAHLLSFFIMTAICLSTVFLKQHSVVDVIGAGLMAYFIHPFIYTDAYAARHRTVRPQQKVAS